MNSRLQKILRAAGYIVVSMIPIAVVSIVSESAMGPGGAATAMTWIAAGVMSWCIPESEDETL